MTTFETIILIVLYLFAFVYMMLTMGVYDEDNCVIKIFLIFIAAAMGVFVFPVIFAVDVWKKLNKEQE